MRIPAKILVKICSLGPKTELMSTQKKCIYLYKSAFCIFNYYMGGALLNPATFAPGKNLVRSKHPPHVLACFVLGQVETATKQMSTTYAIPCP